MELREVLENLCTKDPRHPEYEASYRDYDAEDLPEPRADDCYCDSCFNGTDPLALEILRLRGEVENRWR